MERPSKAQLRKLIGVGNYQFGKRAGSHLFASNVRIECSRKTGRIRHIYNHKTLIATLRPKDGFLALTLAGAKFMLRRIKDTPNRVTVDDNVTAPIKRGGDVFAKHVLSADPELRPGDEVIVTDTQGSLLGVGSAVLSGRGMLSFRRGVAVNLRRGASDDASAMGEAREPEQERL